MISYKITSSLTSKYHLQLIFSHIAIQFGLQMYLTKHGSTAEWKRVLSASLNSKALKIVSHSTLAYIFVHES